MTSLPRRLAGPVLAVALALPIASSHTASAASEPSSSHRVATADGHRAAPSKPVITRTRGGRYARIDFRVNRSGGPHYTVVQARGVRWRGDKPVGECHPPAIRTRGTWIGFSPGGRGTWSFQLRVRNSAGWSPWSDFSRRVRVR